ncbi:MAG: hypothetical protein WA891_03105 [Acidobacteriaceae bacterium]|jgi:hypothetical protein
MTELTEELLANAERLYLAALARGKARSTVYHGEGANPAIIWRECFAQENTKWLT